MYNNITMVILTKRIKSMKRGPMGHGAPLSKKGRALSAQRKAAVIEAEELKDAEERRQDALAEESGVRQREALSREIAESNKDCFVASNGQKVCNAGQGKLFNSPEKIGQNFTEFVLEDLPKASLGLAIAGAAGVEFPLAILALGGVAKGISFGKAFGPTTTSLHSKGGGFRRIKRRL